MEEGCVVAIWIGTSGYNYPEWRGNFYPEKARKLYGRPNSVS
jgi:uncharacterized protein YecE (DUF72 family)